MTPIGYLVVDLVEGAGYVGGVLVTDGHGLPLEFRHTLPVRPTKLQRALYGGALDRYLRAVVITRRLLDGLERKPGLVLLGDAALIGESDPPLGFLADGGVEPLGPAGTFTQFEGAQRGVLLQLRTGDAPVRLVTEAPTEALPDIARLVLSAATTMDVREPLQRVTAGLRLIARGDVADAA